MKTCCVCKQSLPINMFHKGNKSNCKECRKIETREYYLKNRQKVLDRNREWRKNNPEKFRESAKKLYERHKNEGKAIEYSRRYAAKYPDKKKARAKVMVALRSKNITMPEACEGCSINARLEAHHYLGYAKDHWLDIKWLCKKCHVEADFGYSITAGSCR